VLSVSDVLCNHAQTIILPLIAASDAVQTNKMFIDLGK
jgi:hypothetical protein